jgi:hypothetical protein
MPPEIMSFDMRGFIFVVLSVDIRFFLPSSIPCVSVRRMSFSAFKAEATAPAT